MSEGKKKDKPKLDDEAAVLAKIAEFPEPYRVMGKRLHELVMETVPALKPRLWYGLPGYATGGPVLCFFNAEDKYMTFGLTEKASFSLEEGAPDQLMPSAWFFTAMDEATEAKLAAIVRKATG